MEPTATLDRDVAHHAALDARLVEAVGGIRLLGLTSWPATVQAPFLDSVARGQPVLPKVDYPRLDFSEERRALAAIAADCDDSHPLGHYVRQSAQSWDLAAQLLEGLGTAAVDTCSVQLFGAPEQPLPGNGPSTREAARHFIQIAAELDHELLAPEEQVPVSAIALQLQLQNDLDAFFESRIIQVQLDPELVSKAAAGPTRIRLRTSARFSAYDRAQLFHHEALVHSLTALNGREQPVLPSLALSSPRVTATQEGLATFAEQITGSIDIERLKRISLRTEAIAMAREGADSSKCSAISATPGRMRRRASPRHSACSAACRRMAAWPSPRTRCTCAAWCRCTPSSATCWPRTACRSAAGCSPAR